MNYKKKLVYNIKQIKNQKINFNKKLNLKVKQL